MKKFKIKYVVFVVLLAFLIVPMIVFGESSSIESGGGSGAGNSTNDSNKWGYYYGPGGEGGHMVAGIRMTVVDQNGKMVSGTHSVDFVNYPTIKSAGIKMNSKSSRQKNAVIESDISWKKNGNTYIEKMPLKASIKFDSDSNLKINNGYVDTYFKKLAATKNNDGTTSLYTNYIVRTGYNRDNYSNYNKHYILVEPTTAIVYKGTWFYGTATELAKLMGNNPHKNISLIAKNYLARSICYPGDFVTAGKKNNDVTLAEGDTLLKYSKGKIVDNECSTLSKNSDLLKKSGSRVVGNAVGVFYMAAVAGGGPKCDINNPLHFHAANNDYKSVKNEDGTGTELCCEEMKEKYGVEYVERLYPICGACEVETNVQPNSCGSIESFIASDVSNENDIDKKFSCLFKGVSGTGASKYDSAAREGVRDKYKFGTLGTEYCEVYCIENVTGNFPGNYDDLVNPGGTFVWPDYNKYQAYVTTQRTCKIRFRQQEWLAAFNSANNTNKQKLLNGLKLCASENGIEKYYTNYDLVKAIKACQNNYSSGTCKSALEKVPTLNFTYNNGAVKKDEKQLKINIKNSSVSDYSCTNCNINTSSLTINNVTSQLANVANQIANKTLSFSVKFNYVLPDGYYQYVDKKTGELLDYYTPSDPSSSTDSDGKLDTGYSKLLVSEKAKVGNKYDVIIKYSNLSPISKKFDTKNYKYVCKYEVDNKLINPKCDYNEPNHFKDLNGDGKLDSGPNGEDCCEMIAAEHGKDSEIYQDLVKKGWCPVEPPTPGGGGSCEYPRDLITTDIATKNKCCEMVLYDESLSETKRKEYYKQYCTSDPYCPQDCEDGVCHDSPMTQDLRNCMATGKSYNECKIDNCPGGSSIVIYRPISLLANEAFPGVEKLNRIWSNNNWYYYSNWAYRGGNSNDRDYYVDKYITNNRMVKEYEVYNIEPMYVINLDASKIKEIRNYNATHSYDDFNLKCTNDRQCRSDWIKKYVTSDSCGIDTDWYDCDGVDASWGD